MHSQLLRKASAHPTPCTNPPPGAVTVFGRFLRPQRPAPSLFSFCICIFLPPSLLFFFCARMCVCVCVCVCVKRSVPHFPPHPRFALEIDSKLAMLPDICLAVGNQVVSTALGLLQHRTAAFAGKRDPACLAPCTHSVYALKWGAAHSPASCARPALRRRATAPLYPLRASEVVASSRTEEARFRGKEKLPSPSAKL